MARPEAGYRGSSSVGQVVRRVEQRSVRDVALRKKLAMIKANLSRICHEWRVDPNIQRQCRHGKRLRGRSGDRAGVGTNARAVGGWLRCDALPPALARWRLTVVDAQDCLTQHIRSALPQHNPNHHRHGQQANCKRD